VDTEISLSCPEYGRARVFGKTFSESNGRATRMLDSEIQYPNRSYTYGDDHPAEIFSQYGSRSDERDDEQRTEEKVCVAEIKVLAREYSLVKEMYFENKKTWGDESLPDNRRYWHLAYGRCRWRRLGATR